MEMDGEIDMENMEEQLQEPNGTDGSGEWRVSRSFGFLASQLLSIGQHGTSKTGPKEIGLVFSGPHCPFDFLGGSTQENGVSSNNMLCLSKN